MQQKAKQNTTTEEKQHVFILLAWCHPKDSAVQWALLSTPLQCWNPPTFCHFSCTGAFDISSLKPLCVSLWGNLKTASSWIMWTQTANLIHATYASPARRLQCIFYLKTWCECRNFKSNRSAACSWHVDDTRIAVWRHVMLFFVFMMKLVAIGVHWVEFFQAWNCRTVTWLKKLQRSSE